MNMYDCLLSLSFLFGVLIRELYLWSLKHLRVDVIFVEVHELIIILLVQDTEKEVRKEVDEAIAKAKVRSMLLIHIILLVIFIYFI